MNYQTTEAYLSGGICGHMWMPDAMAGKPLHKSARGVWGFYPADGQQWTFREALNRLLCNEGGDFQDARFTADTSFVVVRKTRNIGGKYQVHVWEREISALRECADLVNADAYTSDFFNDE